MQREHHEDDHDMERAAREAELQPSNFDELMTKNEAFRSLTENGKLQRVVCIISAVSTEFSLLKGVADQIDVGRVCVIGLSNNGNRRLIEPSWHLESGIIKNPLPREIAPGDAGVFTFEKTQYSTFGTAGVLTYTIDGTNTQIEVLWSVPFLYGLYSNRFNIEVGLRYVWNNAVADSGFQKKMRGSGLNIHVTQSLYTKDGRKSTCV